MAEVKFNFYNVYTSYYKNINEIFKTFKCELFFGEKYFFLWEDFHEWIIFPRYYKNKTILYWFFEESMRIRLKHWYYISKNNKIRRIITFNSIKSYNTDLLYLNNLIKLI